MGFFLSPEGVNWLVELLVEVDCLELPVGGSLLLAAEPDIFGRTPPGTTLRLAGP